jgi:ketosteroid isomerase-like protein
MNTATAPTHPTAEIDLQHWVGGLVEAIDAKDVARFLAFLTSDARFTFGNFPPAVGTEAIRATLENFFAQVRSLRHTVEDAWRVPGHIVMRGTVQYTRHDGRVVAMPFCNVLAMAAGRVSDYRIYIDPTALFAP